MLAFRALPCKVYDPDAVYRFLVDEVNAGHNVTYQQLRDLINGLEEVDVVSGPWAFSPLVAGHSQKWAAVMQCILGD